MIDYENQCTNGYAVRRTFRKEPMTMPRNHYHEHYEIYYLTQGKVRYFIENMTFDLNAGDMMFIAPNVIHKTAGTENAPSERILLSFTSDFLEKKDDAPLFRCFDTYYLPNASALAPLLHTIEKENARPDAYSRSMIRCCIEAFLIKASRSESLGKPEEQHPNSFQQIAKYISEHYASEITLDMLSKRFAISKSHLSRQFKSATGFHLSEYITLVRVKNAQRLLLDTDYRITEIATLCGFNNSSYFSAVFKRILGHSPKELRRDALLI